MKTNPKSKESASNYSPIKMSIYLMKNYGVIVLLKGVIQYFYNKFKGSQINLTNERVLTVNGYQMAVIPNDKGISRDLTIYKLREPLTTNLVSKFLKEGMICLDIGSNIGYYALLESQLVGQNGKIFAIEPSPLNYKFLERNSKMQEPFNITTFNFAASNKTSKLNFLLDDNSNHSRVIDDNENISSDSIIEISAKKIDDFIQEQRITKCDLFRMDVEGHEAEIYEGARDSIKQLRPRLVIEFHKTLMGYEKSKILLNSFKEDNYDVKYFYPRELDIPIVGNLNDIKEIGIDEVIDKFEKDLLPDVFHLHLENICK